MASRAAPPPDARRSRIWAWAGKLGGLTLGAVILTAAFRSVDLSAAGRAIARMGPHAAWILVPFGVAMLVDTWVWWTFLARLGRRIGFRALYAVRIATEAALVSLSGGGIVAEGLAPYLLLRRWGVPLSEGVATIGARKVVLVVSQGIYIGLGGLAGLGFLAAASRSTLGGPGLGPLVVAIGAGLALVGWLGMLAMTGGRLAHRMHRVLAGIPSARVHGWVGRLEAGFASTDAHLVSALGRSVGSRIGPVAGMLVTWLLEAFETWLILRLLGIELSFAEVWAFEPALALLRHLVFFVPAGLGVQDVGYVLFLKAAGVEPALDLGAAFVVLKRAKELVWVVVGYALFPLVLDPRTRPVSAPTEEMSTP